MFVKVFLSKLMAKNMNILLALSSDFRCMTREICYTMVLQHHILVSYKEVTIACYEHISDKK